jgi:hypothetical protein
MGPLEKFLVTPSHHRVHHAINPEYLDKNFSQIFIVWDKWFGTFQPELSEVEPVYGVKRQVRTWNPILINFQHLALLVKDAWHTSSWKDKLRLWWMPTGWRPDDVTRDHPIEVIAFPEHQVKYRTEQNAFEKGYYLIRLLFNLALMLFLFRQIADYPFTGLLLYGLFLFLDVFAYTSAMDSWKGAIAFDILKSVLALFLFHKYELWFGLGFISPSMAVLVLIFLFLTPLLTAFFLLFIRKEPTGSLEKA